jgi:asparagine synthase (glutamine-hydrolysing)
VCGIFGTACVVGARSAIPESTQHALRDSMRHRGPDGGGFVDCGHVTLAHRRLVVIDPTEGGAQPMTRDGFGVIAYNGELYNDAELRSELAARGCAFDVRSDTLTVLAAVHRWGVDAFAKLRGMYAVAWLSPQRDRLILARDPLGIKPLHYATVRRGERVELIFASEAAAVARALPTTRPDLTTVSSYLTTIRTTLGSRTLFEGVSCLEPGEVIEWDLRTQELSSKRHRNGLSRGGEVSDPEATRELVRDSVRRHLRSDVRTCSLLSGGLDSSIVASIATELSGEPLRTYCAGADAAGDAEGDHAFARLMSRHLGSHHVAVDVTRELFLERWPEMIRRQGLPLSTPNEVAINQVARSLRAQGDIVALSGEGADELFGGYLGPMVSAWKYEQQSPQARVHPGLFQIDDAGWISSSAKQAILSERAWKQVDEDASLRSWYVEAFDQVRSEREDEDGLQAHLRFMRRVNLAGLLGRLDSAMMLEGVEGRTPFADANLAAFAEGLPMASKFDPMQGQAGVAQTKICLRSAFGRELPRAIVDRPKASFPLPFQMWMEPYASVLLESDWMQAVFSEAAVHTVASRPQELWRLSWPMINIGLWAKEWWG